MAKTSLTLWRLTAKPRRSRAKVPPRRVTIYVRAATRDEAMDLINDGVVVTSAVKVRS